MPSDNYVIPLRKAYDDKPRTKRTNVAVRMIYDFLYKHTRKGKEDIIITEEVNNYLWKRGIQKPPRRVEITLREKDGKYYVFLKDSESSIEFLKANKPKRERGKDKASDKDKDKVKEKASDKDKDKAKEKVSDKDKVKEVAKEEPKEEIKEEIKEEPKEEVKEVAKEEPKEEIKENPKEESKE